MSDHDLDDVEMCFAERYVDHLRGQLQSDLDVPHPLSWLEYIEKRLQLIPCDRNFVRWMAGSSKDVVRDILKRKKHMIDGSPDVISTATYYPFCSNRECGKSEIMVVFFGLRTFGYCADCKMADYCCKSCQRADWKRHQPRCLQNISKKRSRSTAATMRYGSGVVQSCSHHVASSHGGNQESCVALPSTVFTR